MVMARWREVKSSFILTFSFIHTKYWCPKYYITDRETQTIEMKLQKAAANLLLLSTQIHSAYAILTDSTIQVAVNLYFSDPATAAALLGPIGEWDVSRVTDMSFLFQGQASFNDDLSKWDVGKVTNMEHMFDGANSFNSDLSKWRVSKVTNMRYMFESCHNFNSDLSNWKTDRVVDMQYLFVDATYFNTDLSKWDVSKVTAFNGMFWGASNFNNLDVPMSKWKTSSGNYFDYMFFQSSSFNQQLCWDTSNSLDPYPLMANMFTDAGPDAKRLPYPDCTRKIRSTKAPRSKAKGTKAPAAAKAMK
jgi:surface protein